MYDARLFVCYCSYEALYRNRYLATNVVVNFYVL